MDNIAGGYALGEHLICLGCQRICFVHPKNSAPTIGARIAGLRSALDVHRLGIKGEWVSEGDAADAVFVRKVLGMGRPDAIVGSNDHTAALIPIHHGDWNTGSGARAK